LTENVHKFVHEFDEVSIVNCTNLFTEEAATRVFDEWKRHAKSPDAEPTS